MEASNSENTKHDESEKERLDRNLEQLLGELRLALPGVQVLFAFLLVVPFNQRFADITSFQRTVYFVTLLCATAATRVPDRAHRAPPDRVPPAGQEAHRAWAATGSRSPA